jgi:hypothetical protein
MLDPSLPDPRIAPSVEDGHDFYPRGANSVVDPIGEPAGDAPSEIAVHLLIKLRVFLNAADYFPDCSQELLSETCPLALIRGIRLIHIVLRLAAEDDG